MSKNATAITRRAFTAFDDDPDILEIVDFVSSGGSLVKYCRQNNLPFGATRRWINQSEDRKLAYKDAQAAHEDWANQTLSNLIMEILAFDPTDIEDDMGNILPISKWPPAARAALTAVNTNRDGDLTGAQFAKKLDAIKMLGSHTAMFSQKPKNTETREKSLEDILSEIEDDQEESDATE